MNFLNKLKNKKVGIVGMGYIGSNLFNVLEEISKKIKLEAVPITRENLAVIKKETFDYLINCAGTSGDFRKQIIKTVDSNIILNVYLLQHLNVKKSFLALSSTRIYGFSEDKNAVFDEHCYECSDHTSLDYIYNGSKKLMESLLLNYSKSVKYRILIARLSNVYGKFDKLDNSTFIKKIIRTKIKNSSLATSQNRNSTKDYIYIEDVIEGILRVLLLSKKDDVFNIASGKSHSLKDISDILDIAIRYNDKNSKRLFSNISIEKAKEALGFHPKKSFREGLYATIRR